MKSDPLGGALRLPARGSDFSCVSQCVGFQLRLPVCWISVASHSGSDFSCVSQCVGFQSRLTVGRISVASPSQGVGFQLRLPVCWISVASHSGSDFSCVSQPGGRISVASPCGSDFSCVSMWVGFQSRLPGGRISVASPRVSDFSCQHYNATHTHERACPRARTHARTHAHIIYIYNITRKQIHTLTHTQTKTPTNTCIQWLQLWRLTHAYNGCSYGVLQHEMHLTLIGTRQHGYAIDPGNKTGHVLGTLVCCGTLNYELQIWCCYQIGIITTCIALFSAISTCMTI